jgi:hypothetical protein
LRIVPATLALLWLAACASTGRWEWRRPDGSHDDEELRVDVHACEDYAMIADSGVTFRGSLGARPVGGWGNTSLEFCMHERNWKLEYVHGDRGGGGAAPAKAP